MGKLEMAATRPTVNETALQRINTIAPDRKLVDAGQISKAKFDKANVPTLHAFTWPTGTFKLSAD